MDWLALALVIAKVALGIVQWREQKAAGDAGEAKIIAGALSNAMAEIDRARKARLAARDDARRDPAGVVRDDDGFRRD